PGTGTDDGTDGGGTDGGGTDGGGPGCDGVAPVGPAVWRPVIGELAATHDGSRLRALGQEILNTPGAHGPGGRAATAAHLAMVSASIGHHEHAAGLLSAELARSRDLTQHSRLHLHLQLAWVLSGGVPRRPDVDALIELAPHADRLTRAGLLTLRALCATLATDRAPAEDTAVDTAAAALDDLAAAGSDGSGPECYYLLCLGWTEAMLGRYDAAQLRINRALRAAREHGETHLLPALLDSLAYVHLQSGRLGEAIEIAREASLLAQRAGRSDQATLARAVSTAAWAGLGRPPEFGRDLPDGVAAEVPRMPLTLLLFAEAALAVGDGAGAGALFKADRQTWRVNEPTPVLAARMYEVLAAAAMITGQDPQPWSTRASEAAARVGLPEQDGHALLARGHTLRSGAQALRCYTEAAVLLGAT
ncbi:tetratricopeptide repeat protein, partial [Frankia sp. AiPs1]|uniref:tetratricopeptide repeat protein n=1 Tax=Frankia sp. AiPs1 TaxID=573493 RepID=UPI00204383CF